MPRAVARSSAGASARLLSTSTTRAGASGPSARSSASRLLPRPDTATATSIGMGGEGNGGWGDGAAASGEWALVQRWCRLAHDDVHRGAKVVHHGEPSCGHGQLANGNLPHEKAAASEPLGR